MLDEYIFFIFLWHNQKATGFFSYLQRKMSCYERNAYAWKDLTFYLQIDFKRASSQVQKPVFLTIKVTG